MTFENDSRALRAKLLARQATEKPRRGFNLAYPERLENPMDGLIERVNARHDAEIETRTGKHLRGSGLQYPGSFTRRFGFGEVQGAGVLLADEQRERDAILGGQQAAAIPTPTPAAAPAAPARGFSYGEYFAARYSDSPAPAPAVRTPG